MSTDQTDLTIYDAETLAITPTQTTFNDRQRTVLQHMGLEGAPDADLQVFMHVCQRTGLDPFSRQIHMIGRSSKNYNTDQWETKYTIQTGIDGYRVIGHRAAERTGESVSVEGAEWCNSEGRWIQAWSKQWGAPIAARVTIRRGGEPFTATANYDEYVQTKRGGGVTSMWAQRGAGQLAKCAEALAWRMAYPNDMVGVYVDDEMQRQHPDEARQIDAAPARGLSAVRAAAAPTPDPEPDGETGEAITQPQLRALHAALGAAGLSDRDAGLERISGLVGRAVESSKDLTKAEAGRVIEAVRNLPDNTEGDQS